MWHGHHQHYNTTTNSSTCSQRKCDPFFCLDGGLEGGYLVLACHQICPKLYQTCPWRSIIYQWVVHFLTILAILRSSFPSHLSQCQCCFFLHRWLSRWLDLKSKDRFCRANAMVIYIQPTMNQLMKQMIHFEVANSSAVNCQSWTHRHTCTLSLDSCCMTSTDPSPKSNIHNISSLRLWPFIKQGWGTFAFALTEPISMDTQKLEALPNQVSWASRLGYASKRNPNTCVFWC